MRPSAQIASIAVVLMHFTVTTPALGQEPKALLMMDINPQGVPPEVARSLTDFLELEIERGRLYKVISQQDLRTLIKVEEQKLLLGGGEDFNQRISEIANRVNARHVLASTLGRVGEAYLLSLELLDAAEVKVLRRVTQTLIGEEQELIGSLRSAVVAITLDEKGVAPDISEELIDKLRISEKQKSVFLTFSPAYELPLGRRTTEEGIPAFRPSFLHLRLGAELPVWPWVRLYGSVSVGTTVSEKHLGEDDHLVAILRPGETTAIDTRFQANLMSVEYSALRIPFNLGVKLVPDTGRFLPYVLAGIGLSWQGYTFDRAKADSIREPLGDGSCPAPFVLDNQNPDLPQCLIRNLPMRPERDISTFGFDAVAAAGFEWLLTHHLGITAEVRYHFTYTFKGTEDLRFFFYGESEPYQLGTETVYERHMEMFTVQNLHENLVFSIGMVMYW